MGKVFCSVDVFIAVGVVVGVVGVVVGDISVVVGWPGFFLAENIKAQNFIIIFNKFRY